MRVNQAKFRVATMCRVLGVSTSGYYVWLKRGQSSRAVGDAELTRQILRIHWRSRGACGAPRIHAELSDWGRQVGGKRVARLMKAADLAGVSRRAQRWKS